MFREIALIFRIVMAAILLSSCAAVDQFGSRIYDGNLNSQNSMNQEMLLNVIRAEYYQSLNFVAITQVTGGQTETVNTGLPTITIGPAQTVAQHQFQVSNSVSSGVTGGYQSNPLVSTQFENGMLSPISQRSLALLLGSHPREPVLYTTVESIVLRVSSTGKLYRFANDPTRNLQSDEACKTAIHKASDAGIGTVASDCNYSEFINFIQVFVDAGLFAELVPADTVTKPNKPQSPPKNSTSDSGAVSSVTEAPGHLCFDPTRALPKYSSAQPKCGTNTLSAPREKPKDAPITLSIDGIGNVTVGLVLRSPIGVFSYLGKMLREKDGGSIEYLALDGYKLFAPGEPFINVTGDSGDGCYVSISYSGRPYCVPRYSQNTPILMDILAQLRNLSISPTDLNSAFTVRLSNG